MPIEAPPLRHVSRFRPVNGEPEAPAWLAMAQQAATAQQAASQAARPGRSQRTATGEAPKLDGMELLFGSDMPQAVQQTQTAPGLDGMDLLFGSEPGAEQSPAETDDPYAEPDAPTWWGRRIQDIRGRQDPRFANLPRLTDQFHDELASPVGAGALFGSSDAQMADIIEKQLGDKFIRREKDANGYDVFVTRGPNGEEQRGYVNKPGLEGDDIARGVLGAVPYVAGGLGVGALTKGMGGLGRMLTYGGSSGATSVAGDLAQMPLGSEQGIEPGKAAITAGAGVLGVPAEFLASKAWGRFVVEPRLFNRSTGQLTSEGRRMAASQGLDPAAMQADIAKTFAETYAKTRSASQAAIKAQEGEFGIPSTIGQRTKNNDQLWFEEAARYNLYGDKARDTMKAFDARQAEAVDFAARTRLPSDFRSQTAQQSGTMNPAGMTHVQQMADNAADLGTGIQTGMRSARDAAEAGEDAAWSAVTDMLPKKEALDLLPDALAGRLGTLRVTPEMPKAAAMAKSIDDYIAGKAFNEPVAKVLQQSPVKTIDEMRRQLLGMYKGASDPTDKAAAKAIYDGFNDWIDDAARQSLVAGDPAAAANLRIARDWTRTMQGLFNPSVKGKPALAAKLISDLMEADSPERAAQLLFGPASSATPSSIKPGAIEALRSMKAALRKYADPRIAGDTIADLKIAYWARLVQSNKGVAHSPQVMLNNINAAFTNQRTMLNELFTQAELGQMRRLANQLKTITYKDPNPSKSSYGVGVLTKQFLGKLLDFVPWARTTYEFSGLPKAIGAASARRAVDQAVRQTPRNALPYSSTVGATYGRQGGGR